MPTFGTIFKTILLKTYFFSLFLINFPKMYKFPQKHFSKQSRKFVKKSIFTFLKTLFLKTICLYNETKVVYNNRKTDLYTKNVFTSIFNASLVHGIDNQTNDTKNYEISNARSWIFVPIFVVWVWVRLLTSRIKPSSSTTWTLVISLLAFFC